MTLHEFDFSVSVTDKRTDNGEVTLVSICSGRKSADVQLLGANSYETRLSVRTVLSRRNFVY